MLVDELDVTSLSGIRGVLEVAQGVLSDFDLEVVLARVLDAARTLSGASYAALGVLDGTRLELEQFLTSGLDEAAREQIGPLPRGRGVLGELITHPKPLRLEDVGSHPRSYGFPSGHPPMHSFLGVPVFVRGEPFGNLYLAEKTNGAPFSDADEQALVMLAGLAGVAIDHARRYTTVEQQRSELERTVQALDATVQIARAVGAETNLEAVLQLVAKRGRALVSARALVIEYERGDGMLVAAGAGEIPDGLVGQNVDLHDSLASSALRTMSTLRLETEPNRVRFAHYGLGRLGIDAQAGLVVPLIFRGHGYGALVAVDRLDGGPEFTAEDQRLLEAFASSAATAVATARSVEAEHRSQRLAAAEQERARWARELHDETLQNLAALRLSIAMHQRRGSPEALAEMMSGAIDQLDVEIANLRALITELRPTALDDLGLEAALEDLAGRARNRGLEVDLQVAADRPREGRRDADAADLETAIYRIAQEALTNAGKHGHAEHAQIAIHDADHTITVTIADDGEGFDPAIRTRGFGLAGMRERVGLLYGTLDVVSAPGEGTTVTASFPKLRESRASSG